MVYYLLAALQAPIIIESVIIGALIIIQIYLFFQALALIKTYKSVFKILPDIQDVSQLEDLGFPDDEQLIADLEDSESANVGIFKKFSSSIHHDHLDLILQTLNDYLRENRGASIDYHIIKEIIDSRIHSIEEDIEARIPSPLYLGLAATMVGIIIGLFGVSFDVTEISAIKPLIDGVKIAMSASVLGLILTSVLSVLIYKEAKSEVSKGKADFLGIIQTMLLPTVVGKGQSAISALANRLDNFGITTIKIVDGIAEVVTDSKGLIDGSKKIVSDNLELINKIENLKLTKISTANKKIFDELMPLMDSFTAFPTYYNNLNQSLEHTATLISRLSELIETGDSIQQIVNQLENTVNATDEGISFFTRHIKEFSNYNDSVTRVVDESLNRFQIISSTFEVELQEIVNAHKNVIDDYHNALDNANRATIEQFHGFYQRQLEEFGNSFSIFFSSYKGHIDELNDILTKQIAGYLETSNTIINQNLSAFRDILNEFNKQSQKLSHLESIDLQLVKLNTNILKLDNSDALAKLSKSLEQTKTSGQQHPPISKLDQFDEHFHFDKRYKIIVLVLLIIFMIVFFLNTFTGIF